MTKIAIRKAEDQQRVVTTKLTDIICDSQLTEKNAGAYEKSTVDFH